MLLADVFYTLKSIFGIFGFYKPKTTLFNPTKERLQTHPCAGNTLSLFSLKSPHLRGALINRNLTLE
tara:strand:+ start:326 stop:526 length:201 start_codon:yes stop_codon:yes gene_type:complete